MNILLVNPSFHAESENLVQQEFPQATIQMRELSFYRQEFIRHISKDAALLFYQSYVQDRFEAVVFTDLPAWIEDELVSVLTSRKIQVWRVSPSSALQRMEASTQTETAPNPFRSTVIR